MKNESMHGHDETRIFLSHEEVARCSVMVTFVNLDQIPNLPFPLGSYFWRNFCLPVHVWLAHLAKICPKNKAKETGPYTLLNAAFDFQDNLGQLTQHDPDPPYFSCFSLLLLFVILSFPFHY